MNSASLRRIAIALLLTLLFAAGTPIQAQPSDRPRSSVATDYRVRVNTDLIVTWAQVRSRKDGAPVPGLGIDDFALREDGQPQRISLVKEGEPLSAVVLIQGLIPCGEWLSLEYSFRRSREALRQLGDDAEIALMVWYFDVVPVHPLTRNWNVIADLLEDRNRLINASHQAGFVVINGELPPTRPGEAVYQAAQYLEKTASPGRRKIIIIISAGYYVSKTHLHTAAEVKELLEKTGTTVYGLFQQFGKARPESAYSSYHRLFSLFGVRPQDKKRRRGGTIEEFIEQTGGSNLIGDYRGSDELLIELTGLPRSSYTIGYYPANADFDGRFRRLRLELSPRGQAKAGQVDIKTRDGYRALRTSLQVASQTPQ
jgi:VWFA-related protein